MDRLITTELARLLLTDDRAVAGPAVMAACRSNYDDTPRTLIGGAVLADLAIQHSGWERLRGSFIFVPHQRHISTQQLMGLNLGQVISGPLNSDDNGDWKETPNNFTKEATID